MVIRKSILLITLLIALVFVSGCIGGDKDEEAPLSGAAILEDEVKETEETEIKSSCDDDNPCTTDVFNELTKECEYKTTDSCCGNNVCEADERCDETTHQTVCAEDCTLTCPAYLIVHKPGDETQTENTFICENPINCEQISENNFKISGVGKTTLTTTVTNIGERAANVITSKFYCDYEGREAKYDDEHVNGIVFWDFFENKEQNRFENLNAHQSGDNSMAYILDIDMTDKVASEADVSCRIVLNSEDFSNTQTIKLMFVE